MAPKIFLTGATGFIGGDILYLLSKQHPDWQWTCLVRDQEKATQVRKAYPIARLVIGSNDSFDLIAEEASKADIVIHTAASDDNEPSARAIAAGLSRRQSEKPVYWLHTSGFMSLGSETLTTGRYGDRLNKVFDDWNNLRELLNHPDHVPHRKVDKIVLGAGSGTIRTAIVCPAVVYGEGRGPVKKTSFPLFASYAQHGSVFAVGKGENIWHNVHVQDLSSIYLLLAEAAVLGESAALWNEQGYYLAENGSYVVKEMVAQAARIGHDLGFLKSSDVSFLAPADADRILPYASIVIGLNSQGTAIRARRILGWKPHMPKFEDEIGGSYQREMRAV